jgi:MFS family permease
MSQTAPARTVPAGQQPTGGAAVISVLAFSGVVVAVMQTLLVPVISELPALLSTTSANSAWVITATLLTGAVSTPVMGRLGDMFGKRRMLLVALSLVVIGSLVCGLTSSLALMIVGRGLQGGAIGAIPLGISIMRDTIAPDRLGSAIGLMSSSLGIGGALALPVAAIVAEHADWHSLFFGAAGLGVVALVLVLLVVPESPVRTPGRFDFAGAAGLSAGLVCLLLAISKGSDWGWGDGRTLGLFGVAVLIFLGWAVFELRVREPLVDLRTTARRQVLLTNLASILVGFGFYASQLVPIQLLQLPTATGYGLGQTMVVAGLCVAPMGVLMMAVSPVGARLTAARGPKVSLMAGSAVLAAAYAGGLALMGAAWQLLVVSAVIGIGVGIAYAAMPSLIMAAVPPSETGSANALNTLMRSIGMSASSAVIGTVLAHLTVRLGPAALPSLSGFRVSYLLACGACVGAVLIAACIPGRARQRSEQRPESHAQPVIRGRVTGFRGMPLADAVVTLIAQDGTQLARALSAGDGGYRIEPPRGGPLVLVCSMAGHQPEAARLTVGDEPVDLDLALTGAGGLYGTVRTAGSGEPVAGAAVVATDPRGEVVGSVPAGEDGEFELAALPAGTYTLAVSAPGHHPVALPAELYGGEPRRQDVELSASASVRGVVSSPDGSPVPDARVALLDPDGNLVVEGTTGHDGRYRFADLARGDYTMVVSGYGPVTAPVRLDSCARRGFDLRLGHEYS